MNTLLLAVTVLAVGISVAALIALYFAFREQRRRSEARVAALRQLAGEPAGEIAIAAIERDLMESEPIESHAHPDAHVAFDQPRAMFGDGPEASPWRGRVAAALVMAVIVSAVGYVLIPRRGPATSNVKAGTGVAQAPLQLLSLRHNQEEGRLVITGLVQNPRAGSPVSKVIATAFLFSADGTFLASGRAPLDFSTLAAGDESPFVIAVPVTAPVARYRVGFRGEDGRVIAHVDRRATGTLARGE